MGDILPTHKLSTYIVLECHNGLAVDIASVTLGEWIVLKPELAKGGPGMDVCGRWARSGLSFACTLDPSPYTAAT